MQGKPQAKILHVEQARKIYQQLGNAQKLEEISKITSRPTLVLEGEGSSIISGLQDDTQ
jgi:hypothetical protein